MICYDISSYDIHISKRTYQTEKETIQKKERRKENKTYYMI